jgi:hypothetical protein
MNEGAPAPGWWLASDGNWYPPELHPYPSPPVATMVIDAPAPDMTAPDMTVPDMTAPQAPSGKRRRRHGVRRRSPEMKGFEDNHFEVRRRPQPVSKKKRGHLTIPMTMLVIAAVAAGAGYVGFKLTHPSPNRSPGSVALDFYEHLQRGDFSGISADVDPADQVAVAEKAYSLPVVQADMTALHSLNLLVEKSQQSATTGTVVLSECNASFSCAESGTIPVAKVGGKWYVDWSAWLALPAQNS